MIRATTPTHSFILPFGKKQIDKMIISYGQHNIEVLKKTEGDFAFEENIASVQLTQEETRKFNKDLPVRIQARIRTVKGDVIASEIFEICCGEVINDEVMT